MKLKCLWLLGIYQICLLGQTVSPWRAVVSPRLWALCVFSPLLPQGQAHNKNTKLFN